MVITIARREIGPNVVSSVLLMLAIGLLSGACASARPNRAALQFTPPPRSAGLIPGSWEKVEGLRLGSPLVVVLKTGARLRGALKALTVGDLSLTDATGKEFIIARSEVGTIVAQVRDDLANGALIGAGVGFSAALTVLAIVGSQDGYVLPSAKWGVPLLLSGLGSLAGMLVDRAHKRERTVLCCAIEPRQIELVGTCELIAARRLAQKLSLDSLRSTDDGFVPLSPARRDLRPCRHEAFT